MDLSAFYGAFSPACFALLGLWLVAVQIRLPDLALVVVFAPRYGSRAPR